MEVLVGLEEPGQVLGAGGPGSVSSAEGPSHMGLPYLLVGQREQGRAAVPAQAVGRHWLNL